MQTSHEDHSLQSIIRVAHGILDGTVGIVAGARQLAKLRLASPVERDPDILFFVGIDSETDHLPLGEVRRQWNQDVLKAKDLELNAYELKIKTRTFEACRNLIQKFEKHVS